MPSTKKQGGSKSSSTSKEATRARCNARRLGSGSGWHRRRSAAPIKGGDANGLSITALLTGCWLAGRAPAAASDSSQHLEGVAIVVVVQDVAELAPPVRLALSGRHLYCLNKQHEAGSTQVEVGMLS